MVNDLNDFLDDEDDLASFLNEEERKKGRFITVNSIGNWYYIVR